MFVSACRNSCLIIRVYSFYYPHKGIVMLTAECLTVHFTLLCPSPLSPGSCTHSWYVPDLWQCHLCPGEGQRHRSKNKRGGGCPGTPPVPVHTWAKEAPADGAPAQQGEDKQHPGVQKTLPKVQVMVWAKPKLIWSSSWQGSIKKSPQQCISYEIIRCDGSGADWGLGALTRTVSHVLVFREERNSQEWQRIKSNIPWELLGCRRTGHICWGRDQADSAQPHSDTSSTGKHHLCLGKV